MVLCAERSSIEGAWFSFSSWPSDFQGLTEACRTGLHHDVPEYCPCENDLRFGDIPQIYKEACSRAHSNVSIPEITKR